MSQDDDAIRAEIAELQDRIRTLRKQLAKQPRRLTAAYCRDVRHSGRAGPDRHTAGPGSYGLALVVKPSGARHFTQRLTIKGRRTDIGLGAFPETTLEQARERAFENRRVARAGGSLADLARPDGAAPAPARRPRAAGVPTLAEAAAVVIDLRAPGWRARGRTRESWRKSFERFPRLADSPVSRIGTPELLAEVKPLWTDQRRAMDDFLTRASVVFLWAKGAGHREDDPVPAVRAALPRNGCHGGKFAALPHGEAGAALAAVRALDGTPAARLALELVFLTGCRSGEARGARWSEVDLEGRLWTISAKRMKAGVEHTVPLCDAAVAVFKAARDLGGGELCFPAPRGGELWDSSLVRVLRRAGIGQDAGSVHGLRSALKDWSMASGYDWELGEMALAHEIPGVAGRYVRSKRVEERAAMMAAWAAYLEGAVEAG